MPGHDAPNARLQRYDFNNPPTSTTNKTSEDRSVPSTFHFSANTPGKRIAPVPTSSSDPTEKEGRSTSMYDTPADRLLASVRAGQAHADLSGLTSHSNEEKAALVMAARGFSGQAVTTAKNEYQNKITVAQDEINRHESDAAKCMEENTGKSRRPNVGVSQEHEAQIKKLQAFIEENEDCIAQLDMLRGRYIRTWEDHLEATKQLKDKLREAIADSATDKETLSGLLEEVHVAR